MKLEGKKLQMSQIFLPDGTCVPVTLVALSSEINEDLLNCEVKVIGYSKGKGFAGHMKRHHFKGGPATHGQSDRARAPGASGATTTPGRVLKGTRRAGRLGNDRVTVKNVKILEIGSGKTEVKLSGPLPGARNSKLILEI